MSNDRNISRYYVLAKPIFIYLIIDALHLCRNLNISKVEVKSLSAINSIAFDINFELIPRPRDLSVC